MLHPLCKVFQSPGIAALLCAVLSAGFLQDASPPQPAITPLSAVGADADGNYVPDRLGDTLRVAGRATVAAGTLDSDQLSVFLQSAADTAGLRLYAPALLGPSISRGDSVVAYGYVDQYQGATQLRVLSYQIVARGAAPSPVDLSVADASQERREGLLARVEGHVINKGGNSGGRYLLVNDAESDSNVLMVFVSNHLLQQFTLDAYEVGDRIRVVGPLTQYDYSAPRNEGYEILPRSSADLNAVGITSRRARQAAAFGGVVLLVSLIAVVILRRQVQRRTRALEESRQRFQHLSEATFEGVILLREDRIFEINDALTTLTGYRPNALIGAPVTVLLDDDSKQMLRASLDDSAQPSFQGTVRRQDGSSFPAEFRVRHPAPEASGPRVITVRDVTRQKKYEQQILEAKARAEEMARVKTTLLNNMSHELRTPITGIVGYAELIISEPPEVHETFAERIKRSGIRLGETLNSVLEMAQIESNSLSVETAPVDVAALAEEVADLYRPDLRDASITLRVDARTVDPVIHSDRRMLYRILSNLVSNAVKFTEQGTITVRLARMPGGLRLSVRDTGIGIAPAFRPKLFDAFKQESEGVGRRYEGSGIGLTITKRMAELLGGTIGVESTPGEGSTFTVTIPDARATGPASSNGRASHERAASEQVSAAAPGGPDAAAPG